MFIHVPALHLSLLSRIPGFGYTIFYSLSSVDGNLGYFSSLALRNYATLNIYDKRSVVISLERMLRSGIAGLYGDTTANILWKCQTIFPKWPGGRD